MSIFERYDRNFDEETDEIDLNSMEIIKDNGHLFSKLRILDEGSAEAESDSEASLDASHGDSHDQLKPIQNAPVSNSKSIVKKQVSSLKEQFSPCSGRRKYFVIPRTDIKDLLLESFEDCELYMYYCEFVRSTDWKSVENIQNTHCICHPDEYDESCFDCLLEYSI